MFSLCRLLTLAREEDDETRRDLGIFETMWGAHLYPGPPLCRAPAPKSRGKGAVGLLCARKPLCGAPGNEMACLPLSLYPSVWVPRHPGSLSVSLWTPSGSQRARVGSHKASSASLHLSSVKDNDDGELGV